MNNSFIPIHSGLSRRDFVAKTVAACASVAISGRAFAAPPGDGPTLPIVVFSKVYQELKLGFEDAATITAEAGLQGIDAPVRPGGEIEPGNAIAQLPQYQQILRKHGLSMPFITTAITSISSSHTEDILRTAKKLGVQFYRLGFIERQADLDQQIREVRAKFKELAALNREVGIGAIFQNHSPSGHAYLGGNLEEMRQIMADFNPNELGVAFDIGHALVVHGEDWRLRFQELKPHIKVAYVKDVTRQKNWVRLGEGEIARTDYFKLLKEMNYRAPICLHIEYDWSENGKSKNRETLLQALKDNGQVLKRWLA
jgi:sugar phosphate isomerase/epimerase